MASSELSATLTVTVELCASGTVADLSPCSSAPSKISIRCRRTLSPAQAPSKKTERSAGGRFRASRTIQSSRLSDNDIYRVGKSLNNSIRITSLEMKPKGDRFQVPALTLDHIHTGQAE